MAITPLSPRHAAVITANRDAYSTIYPSLTFPDAAACTTATQVRDTLLQTINNHNPSAANGSKPHSGNLSPGCQLCVDGAWSCLFINGRCNCSCFYCPASQSDIGLPTTNNLTFRSVQDYVDYLERFGFRGMSLSGGEPLLTPGRSLAFLRAAKKRFGDQLHSWLYTNGSLVTEERLRQLRDAGLDEIRFDIGAIDYRLDKALLAVGIIPTVTVEIPAVPEKRELLKKKIRTMADGGIRHLNLHQMRLTAYNHKHLSERPYTYLHGNKITVLESELTALELIAYGIEEKIGLPINYCSFVYKNRFQHAAARGRGSRLFTAPYEELTATGHLRTLELSGDTQTLERQAQRFEHCDTQLWQLTAKGQRLSFHSSLVPLVDLNGLSLQISYAETPLKDQLSYRNPFRELRMPSQRKFYGERIRVKCTQLSADAGAHYLQALTNGAWPETESMAELLPYEQIPYGLQEYF